jgi:hypothetical protein
MPFEMKRRTMIASAAASTLGAAGCATAFDPDGVRRHIVERSREWTACYVSGNTDVMERILAEDFVGTGPKGRKSDKAQAIAAARRGPEFLRSARVGPIEVRVFGQMALAFGGDLLEPKHDPAATVTTAWTDTWLLRDGRWVVLASHESEVEPAAP